MLSRIVEITKDGRHLSADRGFMIVAEGGREVARIPLDDIAAVVSCAHGLTYSNTLLVRLAERNAVFVVCGSNFVPVSYLVSLEGNYRQAERMDAQIAATLPKNKQLWKQIVQTKIEQQAAVLEGVGENPNPVRALSKTVHSGDPENREAQAARRYWTSLFGESFRRDRSASGLNAMLNYGYMVLRSCVVRAIMGAGLHPTIGIHHSNAGNPMRLADDLMEPFRPYVDYLTWRLSRKGEEEMSADIKRAYVALLETEVAGEKGSTSLRNAIQEAATSLAFVYLGKADVLMLPQAALPLFLEGG